MVCISNAIHAHRHSESVQKVDDIRAISDEFCADGNAKSGAGLSNMVWGFGQFLGALPIATPQLSIPTLQYHRTAPVHISFTSISHTSVLIH